MSNKIYNFILSSEELKHVHGSFNDPIHGSALIKGILIGACGCCKYAARDVVVEQFGKTFIFTTRTTPTRFERFKKLFAVLCGSELDYFEKEEEAL